MKALIGILIVRRFEMDLYEAIEKRRTIRIFKKGASEEQVRKILLAGSKAPSAGNRQSWEFIVIDDPKTIDRLGEIKYRLNRKFSPGPGETQKEVERTSLKSKEMVSEHKCYRCL